MAHNLTELFAVKRFKIAHDGAPVQQAMVAAVPGKKIVVIDYVLTNSAGAAGTAIWESADTDLSGTLGLQAYGNISAADSRRGCLETVAGEALNITTSGIPVGGHGSYIEQ